MANLADDSYKTEFCGENPELDSELCSISLFSLAWEDILFSHIFPHLNWKELFRLSSVSTTSSQCIAQYFCAMKTIDISRDSLDETAFQKVTENSSRIKKLILSDCTWLNDGLLRDLFIRNKSLSHLDLGGCTGLKGTCLLPLAVHCKGLKILVLRECPWISKGALDTLMAHLKSLEEMDLSSCPSSVCTGQLITSLIQRFPLLKRVKLAYVQSVNDSVLTCIAWSLRDNLTLLDVRSCMSVTDSGIRSIGEYCTKLKSILISNCHLVTESSLKTIRGRESVQIDRPWTQCPHELFLQV